MKTPREFDYDLWTDNGKYFMRIKRTSEECEINLDTMRLLRNEEKKMRREMQGVEVYLKSGQDKNTHKVKVSILSLDFVSAGEMESHWLADTTDYEAELSIKLLEQEFCKLLTKKQLDVYENCILLEISLSEYAIKTDTTPANVFYHIKSIRRKAKIFFV